MILTTRILLFGTDTQGQAPGCVLVLRSVGGRARETQVGNDAGDLAAHV
jgi:hypothetical protein